MTTATQSWPTRAETWLDERGKGAWIALMVLAFIFFWPAGLALLAYLVFGKGMFKGNCAMHKSRAHGFKTSGNSAFDTYKADMLRRLEDEQAAFESFLERLREAKDKSEFDAFMTERAEIAKSDPDDA